MITLIFSILNAAQEVIPNATTTVPSNLIRALGQLLPLILIIVILYFFLIRPQNKQRQALEKMINNLKIGDKVITKGGIIAKITNINNNLIVELYDGTKTEILKHAVISVINKKQKNLSK